MTQKDLNDLCTVISIYTQCNSLSETFEQAKYDIPEELKSEFEDMYYNLRNFIVSIGKYSSDKKDIFLSVCNDVKKQQ
jgi:hypothetical protein